MKKNKVRTKAVEKRKLKIISSKCGKRETVLEKKTFLQKKECIKKKRPEKREEGVSSSCKKSKELYEAIKTLEKNGERVSVDTLAAITLFSKKKILKMLYKIERESIKSLEEEVLIKKAL